jgi:argininosuccinate synthase
MDREVMHLRDSLIPEYSRMIYNGFWYSPEMQFLQNMMDLAQENVWGTARLKLYKGGCQVIGRKSNRSLYQPSFATFEEDDVYRQDEATGFIRLLGLRLRIETLVKQGFQQTVKSN